MAFANDRVVGQRYLRGLPEERRELLAALRRASDSGLCDIVDLVNTTLRELIDELQSARCRDRVGVLHYGGHADGFELLLETEGGELRPAGAEGLAEILGRQRGLQVVFLNACATQSHVDALLAAGVPAVIATSQAVSDDIARQFAARFYFALGNGASLRRCFDEAAGAIRATHAAGDRGLYRDPLRPDFSPWGLYIRPGSEECLEWSLPGAAGSPLFGLPRVPPADLPEKPFLQLDRYERRHSEIFFGRDRDIRRLFDAVTDSANSPLLLVYGQSGVGKSSLLCAGVLPRVESCYEVLYRRREQHLGLAGTLRSALQQSGRGCNLGQVWRALEAERGRPVVVVLDQVDEAYTRPNPKNSEEMSELADWLAEIFAAPRDRPAGKMILAFRKEWLPDISASIRSVMLPSRALFIRPLDRENVCEVVAGLTRTERLRQHYGLTVAEDVPEEIAHALAEDRDSPLAPTLQVLLTKMWDRAWAEKRSAPRFDSDLYQAVKDEGIHLREFLRAQLAALAQSSPAVVESGLALDILAYHTTPLVTAEERTASAIDNVYRHQKELAREVVRRLEDLYLLAEPAPDQADDLGRSTRLAHDALAPFARELIDSSARPGQIARRILEARTGAERGPVQLLDEADLVAVEKGATGMRAWTDAETRLVDLSKRQRSRHRRLRAVAWGATTILVLGIVGLGGTVAVQNRNLQTERDRARNEAEVARQVSAFLENLFEVSDPSVARGETITAREVLDRGARKLETELVGQPQTRAQLEGVIGKVYTNLGLYASASPLLEKALAAKRTLYQVPQPGLVSGILDLASLKFDIASFDEAETLFREAEATSRTVWGEKHPKVAEVRDRLGWFLFNQGKHRDEAERLLASALEMRRHLLGESHPDTARSLHNFAVVLINTARPQQALPLLRQALTTQLKAFGHQHPDVAMTLNNLATALVQLGKHDEAENVLRESLALHRKLLGPNDRTVSMNLHNLALLLLRKGKAAEAESLMREALSIARRNFGDDGPNSLGETHGLGIILEAEGRCREAEELARRGLSSGRHFFPSDSLAVALFESLLGGTLVCLGRFDEAEPLLLHSHAILLSSRGRGPQSEEVQDSLRRLVTLYERRGEAGRAAQYRAALLASLSHVPS
ncbi:MAG TPA: tetratricopeptide repeat protein [Thermoanaerobaculia bacterium]|nr:tetratricopeptide repeat protein [Thermoanaerobaculia bacterium]